MEKYIDTDGSELNIDFYEGIKWYYNSNNQLHRLDGPAVEYDEGGYEYLINNLNHRIGGPAIFGPIVFGPSFYERYVWYVNGNPVEVYYIYG